MSQTNITTQQALGSGVIIEAVHSMTGAESIAPDHMGRARVPAQGYVPQSVAQIDPAVMHQVQTLLFRQAAMLDAKCWADWIALFSDDGVYWMPSNPDQTDWASQPSIFAEDPLLMEVRMGRLQHPNAWSQAANWSTNHIVGNVMIEHADKDTLEVYSRFHMLELRRDNVRHFAGSYRHSLVRVGSDWKIKLQRVDMANAQGAYDYVIQAWV
jgi:3-phenylpropionate/cinnamic acid dioxygenase small subunit